MIFNAGVSGSSGGVSRATSIDYTLESANWTNKTYTVTNSRITSDSDGDIKISQLADIEEYTAWAESMPYVTNQSDGSLVITATGDVPLIDIPIVLELIK